MIRHLFKLIWNRKGANFLIVLEIFASFIVVFAMAATSLQLAARYRLPLGFDWHDVWKVKVRRDTGGGATPESAAQFDRLVNAVQALPEVAAAAGAATVPYGGSTWITSWKRPDGVSVQAEISRVSADMADVLGIRLEEGRWFTKDDPGPDWIPLVIDRQLAHALAGDGDPLQIVIPDDEGQEFRVVGVVGSYRRQGEINHARPFAFLPGKLDDPEVTEEFESILIRMAPGTTAASEERLVDTLESIAPGWSFTISQLESDRDARFREKLLPLSAVAVVAAFLLFMVILGLTGVMWQNVTRRTREFGLRRAVGAHRTRIQRQIVGEVAVTSGLGIVAGSLLAAQTPLFGPFTFVPWAVVLSALAVTSGLILVLSAVCGLYPGWTATRIHPAEALHYE